MHRAVLTILVGALAVGVASAQPTCASLGSGSPTVQDVLNATANPATNGCTIGPVTFRFYKYVPIGGAPLASGVSFVATQDVNGTGFTLNFGSSFNAASGFPADAELTYAAFSTNGTNIIANLFQSISGTVNGTSFDRLTDLYCVGIIDPGVSCSPGAETFVTLLSPGGTKTGEALFAPTKAISVKKDMQACSAVVGNSCGGGISGSVSVTQVKNQIIVPTTPPPPGPPGTGCPATKGFWKNSSKHPFPNTLTFPATVAGVSYSKADFYTILGTPPSGGNAVLTMGSQLVAALLNIAAGATHSSSVDTAIGNAINLLSVGLPGHNPPGVSFPINMTSGFVQSSTDLGTAMTNLGSFFDSYNSANFNTCSEGSGLTLGAH